MRWLALAVLLSACTDVNTPSDGAVPAGDVTARTDVRPDFGSDTVPPDVQILASDAGQTLASIGTMGIKYLQGVSWSPIGSASTPAWACSCVAQRSASKKTISVACASSVVAKWCDPQNGAGWGVWLPSLPSSGTVKFATGGALAKLWGAWVPSAGNPVSFSGDYAVLVEAGAFPPSGLVAVVDSRLSLAVQIMLRNQSDATKAVVVGVALTDVPLVDVP